MEFKDALKNLMEKRGMRQVDLCRASGIGSGLMSMYLNGKREPTLTNSIAIADALECTLDELAGRPPQSKLSFVSIGDLSESQQFAVQSVVESMRG